MTFKLFNSDAKCSLRVKMYNYRDQYEVFEFKLLILNRLKQVHWILVTSKIKAKLIDHFSTCSKGANVIKLLVQENAQLDIMVKTRC